MEDRARRVRSLLEGYYGSGDGGAAGGGAGTSSAARNDINGKGFDADQYVGSMIHTSRMEELLQQHVNWAAEIKNLDSDMQMLVYENYSKFISATDTIRKMKDNLSGMEATMEQLLQNVTNVQEKSDSVNASLCERRERIEQLNGTRSLLRKAQFIFDLPKRLRKFLSAHNYRAVVDAYQGSRPILESYGETSFKSVREEADEVIAEVIRQLQHRVTSDQFSFAERSDAATILVQLHQPVEELMDSYLAIHWERLLRQLTEAAEAARRAREAQSSAEGAVQQSLVDTLNRDFVEDFERTAKNFIGIFPMGNQKLTTSTRDLFNEYVGHIQQTMQGGEEQGSKTSDLMLSLRSLGKDVGKMSELVPGASLAERATEAMESAVRQHIVQAFALHELRTKDILEGLSKPIRSAAGVGTLGSGGPGHSLKAAPAAAEKGLLAQSLGQAEALVIHGTLELVEDLHKVIDPEVPLLVPHHDQLVLLVHHELTCLFSALHTQFLSLGCIATPSGAAPPHSGPASLGSQPPPLVLLLSKLAQTLHHSGLGKISATVDSLFPPPDARLDAPESPSAFSLQHFSALFQGTSDRLLQQYADMEGKKLCVMIAKSVTTPNWLKYKEPKDVRMVVDLILQEAHGIRQVCFQLLGGEHSGPWGGDTSRPGPSGRASNTAAAAGVGALGSRAPVGSVAGRSQLRARSRVLERDVAKLFKQKVHIDTKLELSESSIMSTLMRQLLKTYQECARLQTFGKNGYQQIQLDALALCEALRPLVEDESIVDVLMDEVCAAAAERSLDPTPMDAALLDRILQSRREKM